MDKWLTPISAFGITAGVMKSHKIAEALWSVAWNDNVGVHKANRSLNICIVRPEYNSRVSQHPTNNTTFHHKGLRNKLLTWWRHQMETFSALLAICAGNSPVPGEFPTQRPVTRSFDVYFDLRPNGRLSKQSWGWWFETLSRSLWRHRNE